MKKRVLYMLICLCLVLALFPAAALAEGSDEPAEPTAAEQVQELIDALPDADNITEETRADVEDRLTAIDDARLALDDDSALDYARYQAAVNALDALDGLVGAEEPQPLSGTIGVQFILYTSEIIGDFFGSAVGTDGTITFPPDPFRPGYKFVGWYTEPTGGELVTEDTVFTEDTDLYTHWELLFDSIHVAGNGADSWLNGEPWTPTENEMTMAGDGFYVITFTGVEENSNCEFNFCANGSWDINWGGNISSKTAVFKSSDHIAFSVSEDNSTVRIEFDIRTYNPETHEGALYSVYVNGVLRNGTSATGTHTITLDPNGGTLPEGTASTVTTDADGKLKPYPCPTRDGYEFDGWYTQPTGGEFINTEYVFTESTALYAHWLEVIPEIGFSMSGYGNGQPISGLTLTLDKGNKGVASDYNQYGVNYYISLDKWGTPIDSSEKFSREKTYYLRVECELKEGYDPGWPSNFTLNGNRSESYNRDGYKNTVIFDLPTVGYAIILNPNGGTLPEGTSSTVTTDADGKAPDLPTPTRTGYAFEGWYTNAACTTEFDATAAVTANTTLYAKWKCAGHTGGTATCQAKAKCSVCGEEYGVLGTHDFTVEKKDATGALKTAGDCQHAAEYYKSCSVCGAVSTSDKDTFTGETDPMNHTGMKHVDAVEPTTETEGNIEYWHCKDCDRYFSDEDGENEIELEDAILDKLPQPEEPEETEKPEEPVETEKPEEPVETEKPEEPVESEKPEEPAKKPAKDKVPHTGDDAVPALWLALFVLCGVSAIAVGKRKKYSAK